MEALDPTLGFRVVGSSLLRLITIDDNSVWARRYYGGKTRYGCKFFFITTTDLQHNRSSFSLILLGVIDVAIGSLAW